MSRSGFQHTKAPGAGTSELGWDEDTISGAVVVDCEDKAFTHRDFTTSGTVTTLTVQNIPNGGRLTVHLTGGHDVTTWAVDDGSIVEPNALPDLSTYIESWVVAIRNSATSVSLHFADGVAV